MDQVANTSADIAEVLNIQQRMSVDMQKQAVDFERNTLRLMKKMWAEAETLAKDDRDASNPEWLEQQIKNITWQFGTKRNRDEADIKRLEAAKQGHEIRLRRVLRARKYMAKLKEVEDTAEFKKMQEEYASKAAPATGFDVEAKLAQLKRQLALERDLTKALDRSEEDAAETVSAKEAEIAELEEAYIARLQAEARDHPVTRSIVRNKFQKRPPQPFSMDVEIKWADLRNAERALGSWPDSVVHDTLDLRSSRQDIEFLSPDEYKVAVTDDMQAMLKSLERQALAAKGLAEPITQPGSEKTGLSKYIPEIKNPFKRAEA